MHKDDKWLIGAAAGVLAAIFIGVLVYYWPIVYLLVVPPSKGPIFEDWSTDNGHFQIRVQAFHEANGGFVPGAYYTFSAMADGSNEWKEFMTFRHDDPIHIRQNQVRYVDDHVAFAYMGWMFASTSDSGRTWHVLNVCERMPELHVCNYEGIAEVEMSRDGNGIMKLSANAAYSSVPPLRTEDFGQTWHN